MPPRPLLFRYREVLRAHGSAAASMPDTVLATEGRYSLAYVPFEHVNRKAKIVIVGITPGPKQREQAYAEASRLLRTGADDEKVLAGVKKLAAFGGPTMRPNLERMVDAMGISRHLGIASAAELWGTNANLMHATSVVPHAAFVRGKPFAGSFSEILRSPILRECFEADFAASLNLLPPTALFVGLGPTPAEALAFVARQGIIDGARVLGWLAHPSTSSGSQVGIYLGERNPDDLDPKDPVRSRVAALLSASADLRRRLKQIQP